MLLNTSFNIMGKPIMHSVEDAIGLFYTTGLDALVIEDYLIEKVSRPDRDRIQELGRSGPACGTGRIKFDQQ
jgi:hypothetical protein